jgi:murein DD-endopeptidase MepM/ murein hydrolase activator NlpD
MNLAYPLEEKGVITSKYGYRIHPVKKRRIHHNGIDIGVKQGTSVKAIEDGKVMRSDMVDKNGYGNFICIKHNNLGGSTKFSCYAHLSSRLKSVGDDVVKGEEIGKSGGAKGATGSGSSTGPHLHFEIRKNGVAEDPLPYFPHIFLISSVVKRGDKGPIVVELQRLLGIEEDGDFGPQTEKAVLEFQKLNGLVATSPSLSLNLPKAIPFVRLYASKVTSNFLPLGNLILSLSPFLYEVNILTSFTDSLLNSIVSHSTPSNNSFTDE